MSDVVLGSVEEIPVGEGRTFAFNGEQIAVFRNRRVHVESDDLEGFGSDMAGAYRRVAPLP